MVERLFNAKWVRVGVAIMLLTMPADAMAQSGGSIESWDLRTGNDYLSSCGQALDPAAANGRMDGLVCHGYIRGVLAGIGAAETFYMAATKQHEFLCLPPTVNVGQLMRIALKYLNDHPADLHGQLEQLLLVSWVDRFPCPKRR